MLSNPWAGGALRRWATAGGGVTVLCYHTVGPNDDDLDAWTVLEERVLREQLAALRRTYEIVSLDEAIDNFGTPTAKPRAVLTFDDGELGLHRQLLPMVDELGVPVTVYVATGQIETGRPYWFDRLMNGLQTIAPATIDLGSFGIDPVRVGATRGPENWLAIAGILEALKNLAPADREQATETALRQVSSADLRSFTPIAPMNVSQLQDLAKHPLVTLGSHTHCHSLLDQLDIAEAVETVQHSCRLLTEWTGNRVEHFAYPNGNFTRDLEFAGAQLGFKSATALKSKVWRGGDSAYAIPRIPIGRYDDVRRFGLRLAGL